MNVSSPIRLNLPVLLIAAALTTGCSWDSLQRTSYETLESMRQQQCLDQPDEGCPADRTSYDEYQSERDRLQEQEAE